MAQQLQHLRDVVAAAPRKGPHHSSDATVAAQLQQARADLHELLVTLSASGPGTLQRGAADPRLAAQAAEQERQLQTLAAAYEARERELGRARDDGAEQRRQYMRAESQRKALVFQKRYLLMLLGRYHLAEEATLAFVARLSGQPAGERWEDRPRAALHRFRAAAFAVVSLHRLHRLTRRWRHGGRASIERSPRAASSPARPARAPAAAHDAVYLPRLARLQPPHML